jgi:predicted deacylase
MKCLEFHISSSVEMISKQFKVSILLRCFLDIVTITDFNTQSEEKAQVYISGTLHGNERIGPNTAYYLIEFLVSNFGSN